MIDGFDGQTFEAVFETEFRSTGTPPPVTGAFSTAPISSGIPARAAGGPMSGGQVYRVGEGNRPELYQQGGSLFMVPGDSGHMFSNAQSERLLEALSSMGHGDGGLTINLHGTGDVVRDMGTVVTMAGVTRRTESSRR